MFFRADVTPIANLSFTGIHRRGVLEEIPFAEPAHYADAERYFERMRAGTIKDLVAHMMGIAPVELPDREHLLIDVGPKEMKAGQLPMTGQWHTDCTMDQEHNSRGDGHLLMVLGPAMSQTEFLLGSIESGEAGIHIGELVKQAVAANQIATMKAWPQTVYRYGRGQIHRDTPAIYDGWRLRIRITATDIIKPQAQG